MNTILSRVQSLSLLIVICYCPALPQQWHVEPLLPAPDNAVLDAVKFQDRLIVGGQFTEFAQWNGGTAMLDLHTAQPSSKFFFPRPISCAIPYNEGWLIYVQDSAIFEKNYGTLQWVDAGGTVKQRISLVFGDAGSGAAGINTMAAEGDTVYIAGGFYAINGTERHYAAALRISTGEILAWRPRVNNFIRSIALSKESVCLSGLFDTVSGSYQKFIARVSKKGGELQPWPKPIPERLTQQSYYFNRKIVVWEDQLFTVNGSMNIETSEEGAWRPLPLLLELPGILFFIADIAISNGVLYSVGKFSSMNNQPRNGMAAFSAMSGDLLAWDPNKGWKSTVRDRAPSVSVIKVVDTVAYCTGDINNIAGLPVRGIAAVSTTTGELLNWKPSVPKYAIIADNLFTVTVPPDILAASKNGVLLTSRRTGTIGEPFTQRTGLAEVDLRTGMLSPW